MSYNGTDSSTMNNPFGPAPTGNGQYDQLFAANPYRQQTYQKSFWESLASNLGFRTGYDDWLDQTSTQIAEYDAGIYNMMFQNQFNSESSKAERMRSAGLNPDLLGTSDVSDSASPPDDPNGMIPNDSGLSDISGVVTGFGKSLLSAFSTGLQIYKGMAEVNNITETLSGIAIGNADATLDLVDKAIVGSIPLSAFTDKADGIDSYLSSIDFSKYGLKGKALEAANSAFADRFDSIKNNADVREQLYKRYNAISSVNKTAVGGLIPPSLMPGTPQTTNEVASPNDVFQLQIDSMANVSRQILELGQVNNLAEESIVRSQQIANEGASARIEGNELEFEESANLGEIRGANAVLSADLDNMLLQCKQIIASEKATMYSRLKTMSDEGSKFATAMLYSLVLQDFMQFEFSADAGLDLSLLGGIGSLVKGVTKKVGKGISNTFDDQFSESFKRSFGTGLSTRFGVKTK